MEAGGLPVELWGMALSLLDVSELYACLTVSKLCGVPCTSSRKQGEQTVLSRRDGSTVVGGKV